MATDKAHNTSTEAKFYPAAEEKLNILSHALGFMLSAIGLVLLLIKALPQKEIILTLSFIIYGFSMMLLYGASTTYHRATDPQRRLRLKIYDHAAIYVFIAGSYTPFTLAVLKPETGLPLFILVWSMALVGGVLKIFFSGRYKLVSTLMYVFMGWMIVFFWSPLKLQLAQAGLDWLIAGGISYTIGAVLYSIKKIPYNHALFHHFVLLGSICQFISVYRYIA